MTAPPEDNAPGDRKIKEEHAYSALVSMRVNYDTMIWQTPIIALTAQAFLLVIAYDDGKPFRYRCISGVAAFLIGLASLHLFVRHRYYELEASRRLEKMEKNLPDDYHVHVSRPKPDPRDVWLPRIVAWPSGLVWGWVLFIISLAGLVPLFERVCWHCCTG